MVRMTATEASRGFSDLLGRVASGDQIEITRAGAPVAIVSPARGQLISADRFDELFNDVPSVDDGFAADVREARRLAGDADGDPWAS